MKPPPLIVLFALSVSLSFAQDARAPQPRVKLDPGIREAIASTATESKSDVAAPASTVMMDRFVVKGIAAMPFVQRKEPVLREKFTPLRGGSFVDRNFGKTNVFIGIKPWVDIIGDGTSPTGRINFTLLQLGF